MLEETGNIHRALCYNSSDGYSDPHGNQNWGRNNFHIKSTDCTIMQHENNGGQN
jgi:hypothetical protein